MVTLVFHADISAFASTILTAMKVYPNAIILTASVPRIIVSGSSGIKIVIINVANNARTIEAMKKNLAANRAQVLATSFAYSEFHAHRFCQTTIQAAIPNHIAENNANCVTLNDAQYAAAATNQKVLIIDISNNIAILRADCSIHEGIAIIIVFFNVGQSNLKSLRDSFSIYFQENNKYIQMAKPKNWLITVMVAAQVIHQPRIQPTQNIKNGARIKFSITQPAWIYVGIWGLPIARMIHWKLKYKNEKNIQIQQILMKERASS